MRQEKRKEACCDEITERVDECPENEPFPGLAHADRYWVRTVFHECNRPSFFTHEVVVITDEPAIEDRVYHIPWEWVANTPPSK